MKARIDITQTRVFPFKNSKTKIKAFARVVLNGALCLSGLRVIDGANGLFVGYPNSKGKDGNYYDIYHPLNRESRNLIQDAVLADYEKEVTAQPA